jgi:hypothetical protein
MTFHSYEMSTKIFLRFCNEVAKISLLASPCPSVSPFVCLFIRMSQLKNRRGDFHEICCCGVSLKFVDKIQAFLRAEVARKWGIPSQTGAIHSVLAITWGFPVKSPNQTSSKHRAHANAHNLRQIWRHCFHSQSHQGMFLWSKILMLPVREHSRMDTESCAKIC